MPNHVHAQPGDVADFVLLPGDPDRASYIAEHHLENARLYNDHRGLLGYSGTYRGLAVSVQTTGMGCPTTAIVLEELIELGAQTVIRVGTCGSLKPEVQPGDLVLAQGSLPFDGTTRLYLGEGPAVPLPSWAVLRASAGLLEASNIPHHVGLLASSDTYYAGEWLRRERTARGAVAVEMEASAIFTIAMLRGIRAGCLCTVSNHVGQPHLSREALRPGVDAITALALETFRVLAE
ncbi:phosphorylase family protein [Deinococcus alpinitundrae]|uniref:phosphorylase family protein n=1 Tax=Deinococcus alpinitundrae TaxID=468913 RepID=UPI00137A8F45|nr:purine-nucleoside phosphorylase [Deinococcus alpinitundrae]